MKLYNTPTKVIEEVTAANDKLTIYTCGPTVYDYPHIGNWYTFVRYDLLNRVARSAGFEVVWVMNITDVGHLVSDGDDGEDKLEKGARREGKTAWDVAKFYGDYFLAALDRLNFLPPTKITKATDYIEEQIELVKTLEEKGFTYLISDGVYFDTSKFPQYADFAGLNLIEQEAGARVEVNKEKRNAADFALWKLSPKNTKRDMEWNSPWGRGFPGWHLECSAMIKKELGQPIDIHGGGIDHIPVHHTNEIAQSVAAYGASLARHWMHCNHILVDGQKMAKSAGGFIKLEDIEEKGISLDAFRLHVLSGHYRSQSDFSWSNLEATANRLKNWQRIACLRWQSEASGSGNFFEDKISALKNCLADDLDTPTALRLIDETWSELSRDNTMQNIAGLKDYLSTIDELLGLRLLENTPDINDELKQRLADRASSRSNNDWEASDSIRDELKALGIGIDDTIKSYWYYL